MGSMPLRPNELPKLSLVGGQGRDRRPRDWKSIGRLFGSSPARKGGENFRLSAGLSWKP